LICTSAQSASAVMDPLVMAVLKISLLVDL
jgi:hypothetical protein